MRLIVGSIAYLYCVPTTILADGSKNYHPLVYTQEFMGTELTYKFNNYRILDQDENLLRKDFNLFAVVVLTSLMAIKHKKISDEELKTIKHDLYDEIMKRKMEKSERQGIYDFLAYYVQFENSQMLRAFEQEVEQKQGRNTTVGTREYLLEKAKNEGVILGIKTERATLKKLLEAKNHEIVSSLILDYNFTDEQAAKAADVSIDFVQKVRTDLGKKKN